MLYHITIQEVFLFCLLFVCLVFLGVLGTLFIYLFCVVVGFFCFVVFCWRIKKNSFGHSKVVLHNNYVRCFAYISFSSQTEQI